MKFFFTLISSLIVVSSVAQITIEDHDFPSGGDTAVVSISTDFEIDFLGTGEDYFWDFSDLTRTAQRIDTFFTMSEASVTYQLVFNNGWFDPDYQAEYYKNLFNFTIPSTDFIGVSIENPVGFTKIESDRVEIVGVGLEIAGFDVPVKNEIIDKEYELPLNYEDSWISNSLFEIDLNPAYDGILRRYQERISEVDGWGMITTPFGTFNVLRTVSQLDFTDSVRISVGGDPLWIELPTPSQNIYSWWGENQKIPVLQIVTQSLLGEETITSIEYRDQYAGDASIAENGGLVSIDIYPNPATNFVQLKSIEKINFVEVYSEDGRLCKSINLDQTDKVVDLSSLKSGLYFIMVNFDSGMITKKLLVE